MSGWYIQGVRYAIVGVLSNLVLYFLYLVITTFGIGHKTAMTLIYIMGVLQTFFFNKRWSFNHDGPTHMALIRYIIAYVFGYLFNLAALMLLVDHWELSHQLVQGVMIVTIAGMLFLLQRFWVFASKPEQTVIKEET